MQLSEAVNILREALRDNDSQVWSDTELEFILEGSLAQVNQVRPQSVRDLLQLEDGVEQYQLEEVHTVTHVDLDDENGKKVHRIPGYSWEVWGDNESANQTLWISRIFPRSDMQVRVHGYAPWVWDGSEDCEDDVYDWITPENSSTAVSGNNVTTTPPLEEGIDHAWWGGNWGDSAVDIYAEPVTYAEGIPSHLVSISLTCHARSMDDGGTPHTMGTGIKLHLWEEGHDPDYEAPDYVYTDPGGETDQWQALSIQANLPPNIAAFQWFGGTNGNGNMAYGNVQITLGCTEFEDPQSPDQPEV